MFSIRFFAVVFLLLVSLFVGTKVAGAQLLNEFVPNSSPEWIEIYNNSLSSVDLSGYFFDDDSDFNSDEGSSTKVSLRGIITPGGLCYWDLNTYLNNGGDSPTLFDSTGTIIDTYTYSSSNPGKSYARVPDGGEWLADQEPTKVSSSCQSFAPTPTSSPAPTPTTTSTPSPSPTPKPTNTPKPSATPKPTNSSSAINTPISKPSTSPRQDEASPSQATAGENSLEVLGIQNISERKDKQVAPTPEVKGDQIRNFPWPAAFMITSGLILILVALYPFFKNSRKEYNQNSDQ